MVLLDQGLGPSLEVIIEMEPEWVVFEILCTAAISSLRIEMLARARAVALSLTRQRQAYRIQQDVELWRLDWPGQHGLLVGFGETCLAGALPACSMSIRRQCAEWHACWCVVRALAQHVSERACASAAC
jgi:hypothetical protein